MSAATITAPLPASAPPDDETIADLLERLGDIPPSRVRLRPYPGTATEADVIAIEASENRLFELIDGVLVEKGMGYAESRIAVVLIVKVGDFLEENDLGILAGADGMIRLRYRRVRIPDVSFVSWGRIPDPKILDEPIPDLVPDLAVEVLSESNTRKEMALKLREYFEAGVRLVWYVDPPTRSVRVFTGVETWTDLGIEDTIEGGDVLPGFRLSLKDWFEKSERGGPKP